MRRWGKQIEDWDDLLLPGLRNRMAFMDYPREFLGIALKTLGVSYNAGLHDLHACGITRDQLSSRVHHLIQQAKVMSNENHIRAYAAGDVDVIVGSSQDLLPLAQKSSSSRLIVPASGTALWADIWCIPTNASGGYDENCYVLFKYDRNICILCVSLYPTAMSSDSTSPLLQRCEW